MPQFVGIPSVYPKLLELRKSTTASLKSNPYLKESTILRYYQVIGALHMILLQRMVLGDATGIGKSIQGITAYALLLIDNPNLKLLVVCPKSALGQWAEEFEKFTKGISLRIVTNEIKQEGLSGSKARQKHYKDFKENVMIINYHPLMEEYEAVSLALGSEYMIIFDECVAFKSRKTQTHFACSYLAEKASRVYGFSATIIKNDLEEVYSIYAVIVPGLFGKITHFRDTYCLQKLMEFVINGKRRKIPKTVGYKNLVQFRQVLDPYFLIRRKEEVASELPKLISKKIILEMEEDQKLIYMEALNGILYEEKIKQEFFEIMDKVRTGANDEKTLRLYEERKNKYEMFLSPEGKKRGKLAALTYCQMISNGPQLVKRNGKSSKEIEFERLMQEELKNEKIILFTRFKSGIQVLEIICERNKIKYTKITGDQNNKERDEARASFQNDPDCRIMLITTAGSAALNLQAASTILFFDTPWSYGDLVQTIGRAQRIGSLQEHILIIHLVNKSTIDVRVMNKVTDKKNLSDEILGNTAEGALDFTKHEDRVIDDLFNDILEDAKELKNG